MKFALAFVIALLMAGSAHAQQLKAVPVKSYVLTDPDGTPRYLVQYSEESNFRRVYYVKPAKSADSIPPQRPKVNRSPVMKKRFVWPNEIM
jgi:hypothetical protein